MTSGQIVTNTTGSTVTRLNTESVPNLVLPPFTVSTVGTLSGCTTSPQVERFRDGIDVGQVTLTIDPHNKLIDRISEDNVTDVSKRERITKRCVSSAPTMHRAPTNAALNNARRSHRRICT